MRLISILAAPMAAGLAFAIITDGHLPYPYGRESAVVQFPGGYITEIHAAAGGK